MPNKDFLNKYYFSDSKYLELKNGYECWLEQELTDAKAEIAALNSEYKPAAPQSCHGCPNSNIKPKKA